MMNFPDNDNSEPPKVGEIWYYRVDEDEPIDENRFLVILGLEPDERSAIGSISVRVLNNEGKIYKIRWQKILANWKGWAYRKTIEEL